MYTYAVTSSSLRPATASRTVSLAKYTATTAAPAAMTLEIISTVTLVIVSPSPDGAQPDMYRRRILEAQAQSSGCR